jgi:redox-sensing transcriptional repressor
MNPVPIRERIIERLCIYRRILCRWALGEKMRFHSHELAEETGFTSAQVRRDMMSLNTVGTPRTGYLTDKLIEELCTIIEGEGGQKLILVGLGNLGSAIVKYLAGMQLDLKAVAAFETDPAKIGQTLNSVPCLSITELERVVKDEGVLIAVIAVPNSVAQETATRLADAGIRALVNFTSVKLKPSPGVFVEDVDISISLEKSAYFARMLAANAEHPEILEREE